MALRGTLKDFGIADIFQLIGHQTKTGRLILKNRDSEVRVSFKEGNVVRVESTTRSKKELLGDMLVRAEIISDRQLEEGLEDQRRSLRRLGDILVQNQWVRRETLNEFTRLQATETIYRLFSWQNGTYEFEQVDTESDPDFGDPMRAESVLMEGFRMVDEWPMIRKKITGYGLTFAHAKPLPEAVEESDDIDDAFGEMDAAPKKKKSAGDPDIGASERKIYDLIRPGREVQKLIDMGRIGEFETCKALTVLLNKGYISAEEEHAKNEIDKPLIQGGLVSDRDFAPTVVWTVVALVTIVALVAVAVIVSRGSVTSSAALRAPAAITAALVQPQRARLVMAIEAHRAREGSYPESIEALVTSGLLETADLVHPTGLPFQYERADGHYVLTPPVP